MSQTQTQAPISTPFSGYDGISTTNKQDSPDEYLQLKEAGFSDDEIRGYFRPILEEAGFADQEINSYFNSYQIAEGKQQVNLQASLSAYFQHGLQSSVAGLWAREKLPDALTAEQQAGADWLERLTMSTGQLIGDLPAIVGGGALGTLGGPAAPVTIPASALAITEGLRASYMARIKEGHTEDFFYLSSLPSVLEAAGKGGVVGAATGGSGVLVNKAAMALGAGVKTAAAAGVGAEIATMPTAGAAMEGRLPHPQEFVDAALFIGTIRGVKAGMSQTQALVPKLRDIYAKTGKTPSEVAKAAQENQTVMQDLMSENKTIPDAFVENAPEVMNRKGGDTVIPVDPNKPIIPENGVLNHEDAVSLSSVVENIGKALDVPIRTGKMGPEGRGALGIFKVKPEVIRTKMANDVTTIMHEAGHYIQKALYGDIDWRPLAPFRAELAPIATKPKGGKSNLPEGFAEFVAKYVCDPQEALRVAPKFYEHFEALLQEKSPEFQKALLNAREAVRKWADQPAALEVLSHVNIEGRQNEGLLARLLSRDSWDRLYTNFIDRLYPLRKATDIMAQGQELSPDMNPYILARTFAGAKGKATHFIEHSPFEFGTWKNVGKPLAEILRSADNLDDFRAYLVSRRGLELEARGIKSGIRKEAMDATVKQFEEKYGALAKELDEYQDHLVNYLVDSGVLSKEAAKAMRDMNKSYVPFFRVMEKDTGFLGNAGKTLTARNPVKRIKGSGRDIIDPLESIIKNTYAMVEAAEKNAVGRALTDLAAKTEGSGWLVEKLPTPKEAVKVSREEVNRAFLESLGDIDPAMKKSLEAIVKSGAVDDMVTFWQDASMLDKKSQIAVYRDGKRQVYQVAPELAEVMNGLNAETVPLLVKLVSVPAKLLRAGATLTPDFMVRNMIRDAVSAGVVSRSGFIPGLDTARGLKRAITKDDTYWNWVKAGGDQASLVSMDRTTLQNTVKDIASTGYLDRVWNVVKNPIEVLRLGSEMSEKMTRLGEFGKAVQKHGSDKAGLMQAAYESRDLMDFSRRGRLTNSFNVMTAFFNASVQGLDRTARGFKENPKRFIIRAALFIGIPSIINAIRNYGDEDIAQVPRAQRDLFWCVPIGEGAGKTILRIPKPFEQGVMFGSSLERTVEFIMDAYTKKYGGDINKARQEAFRGLGASIFDVSLPNAVPTAFAPFIEHFANRSIPFDRPIVPADREGLLPEYQYAPYTTELTKALAHYVGVLPPFNEMQTFSPARAENYVRGWTGGMGMYVLQALDAMGRNANLLPDPVKPADTLADIPFVRAFVVRNPSMGAESIQRFYDSYNQAHSYLRTINSLKKDFKFEDVANLLPYSAYQAMEGPKRTLSDLTKTISVINKSPDMTPDQKRQLIDALYFRAVETAKLGNMVFEALQPQIEQLKIRAEK